MAFKETEVLELLVKTGRRCCLCKGLHSVQVHHIIPKEQGGSDDIDNGIPLCPNCHDQVHAGGAVGRVVRKYSETELKGHRQFTINLVSQSVTPAIGNTPSGPTVTALMKLVSDSSVPLTKCFVEGLNLAQTLEDSKLEEFCRDELTGYRRLQGQSVTNISNADGVNAAYRTVECLLCARGEVDLNFFMTGTMLLEEMRSDTNFVSLRMVFPEPISEIETLALRSNPQGLLTISLSASAVLPQWTGDDWRIGGYMPGDTPVKLLSRIRTEFMNRLLAIQ